MAVVTPDMPELFEEAYERAGTEMRSGYDLKSARRSLNMLLLEWQNRGLNLFSIAEGTEALVAGTASYTMPTDTIDLIEHHIRSGTGTNQTDQSLTRVSVSTYAAISNKNTTARPTQIYVQRNVSDVTVKLWPVPDTSDYTLVYYRLKGSDGISSGVGTTPSVPPRFVPALVSGLAYYIAMKRPELAMRVAPLQQEYEMQYRLAAEEDRDRASVRFIPMGGY